MSVRTIIRWVERFLTHPFRTTKSLAIRLLAMYLVLVFPANYASMASFTNLSAGQFSAITKEIKSSGAGNILTGGLLNPIKRGFEEKIVDLVPPHCENGNSFDPRCSDENNDVVAAEPLPNDGDGCRSQSKEIESITPGNRVADFVKQTGPAIIDTQLNPGEAIYGDLDALGRSMFAKGSITHKMVEDSAGWRAPFEPGSDPSGWGDNQKVEVDMLNGKIYRGYFWNRSHMIADSLGGRSYRNNLVTGTRMQNVGSNNGKGGMAFIERRTVSFIKNNPQCPVYYSVVNNYNGNELVPRSTTVDVKSCDGSIDERDIVLNVMPGFEIDYNTGSFRKENKCS